MELTRPVTEAGLAKQRPGAVRAGAVPATARTGGHGEVPVRLEGLLAGAALPVQGAVDAQLRADLDEPIAVGAVSFIVAAARPT